MRVSREQVVAFRAAATHLDRRLPAGRLADAFRPCGLQDTPPGSALVGAAARVEGVTPQLWHDPRLASLWAMRGSPFFFAAEDLAIFTAGLHVLLESTDDPFLDWLADRLHAELHGRHLTKGGLRRALYPELPRRWQGPCPFPLLTATASRAVPRSGGYVIAERMGGPRSYDWAVGRADQWSAPLERYDPEQAAAELVRCFLRAFGPATVRDFVWWSWRETHASHTTERAWKTMRDECVEVQHRDRSPGLVLEADVDRLTNPPPLADVRLLPPHDPLLTLPDRATLVPEPSLHRRLWRSSHNPGVVLTGSDVAATWRWREGRIRITPLAWPLSASTREAIEREAGFIAAARGVPSVEVVVEAA